MTRPELLQIAFRSPARVSGSAYTLASTPKPLLSGHDCRFEDIPAGSTWSSIRAAESPGWRAGQGASSVEQGFFRCERAIQPSHRDPDALKNPIRLMLGGASVS